MITPKKAIPAWTGCLDISIKIRRSVIIFTYFDRKGSNQFTMFKPIQLKYKTVKICPISK